MSVTGTPDDVVKAGASVADIAAGMYAYSNILSALLLRARTGEGSHIDVSMLEALTEWMGYPLYYSYEDAPPPPRMGASHSTIYPYGPFTASDGRVVMLGLQNEREWVAFCEHVMDDAALATDERFCTNARRSENRIVLGALIESRLGAMTGAQLRERLDRAQIANGDVNTMRDVWQHPQLAARGRWTEVDSPAGPVPALKPPGINDRFAYRMGPIPAVGEHTQAILRELGLVSAEDGSAA